MQLHHRAGWTPCLHLWQLFNDSGQVFLTHRHERHKARPQNLALIGQTVHDFGSSAKDAIEELEALTTEVLELLEKDK